MVKVMGLLARELESRILFENPQKSSFSKLFCHLPRKSNISKNIKLQDEKMIYEVTFVHCVKAFPNERGGSSLTLTVGYMKMVISSSFLAISRNQSDSRSRRSLRASRG